VLISGLSNKSRRSIAIARKVLDYGINYYTFQARGFIRLYKAGSDAAQTYSTDHKFPLSLVEWAFKHGRPPVIALDATTLNYAKNQKEYEFVLGIVDGKDDFSASLSVISDWCAKQSSIICFRAALNSSVYDKARKLSKAKEGQTTVFIIKNDLSLGYHFQQQSITCNS
jgi:hypothetical protein